MEAFHAPNLLDVAAPAPHRETEYRHRPRNAFTQCAQAHHTHGELRARQGFAVGPLALRHIVGVSSKFAEMPDQRVADIFGHLIRHAGVIEPHHQRLRRQVWAHQGIDARAHIEERAQLRLLGKKLLGWLPDDGVARRRCAGLPQRDGGLGQGGAQTRQPLVGVGIGAAKSNVHGGGPGNEVQGKWGIVYAAPGAGSAGTRRISAAPSATCSPLA